MMKKQYIFPKTISIELRSESIIALSSGNTSTIDIDHGSTITDESEFATRRQNSPWDNWDD